MTLLPLKQGCTLLGIDPKTLRHWMQQANLPVHPHPSDARIKCVTAEQLEQVAALHGRPLDLPASPARLDPADPCPPHLVSEAIPQVEPDLRSKLAHLETQLALVQQQVAGLALQLLQERTERYEQRLHRLEALFQPSTQHERPVSALQPATREQRSQPDKLLTTRRVHPAKGRPRPILPLIEYTPDGTYIIMCPQQGELALVPDSPEWFAWLETISSLRFLGQQGRWSAYRDKGRASSCWLAYRRINGHQYVRSLGSPHQLTLARFEQMAATLQSFVTAS
jgi:DNA-binding transcriptional MerR regulator